MATGHRRKKDAPRFLLTGACGQASVAFAPCPARVARDVRKICARPSANTQRAPPLNSQVGQELLPYMRAIFGIENVIASDVRSATPAMLDSGPFNYLDVTQYDQLARVVLEHGVDHIVHLAALLSATGERSPQLALQVLCTTR